jgi:hypothetical protein
MPSTLNEYKRNPKTNKLEKTGKQLAVGNVERKGGGYKTGVIPSGATAVRDVPSGKVYSNAPMPAPVAPPIVPSSTLPVPPVGDVPAPPPALPLQGGGGSAPSSNSPGDTALSPSNSPAPGGVSTPQQQQTKPVTVFDSNGVASTFNVDPRYSFISQTGQYQHPFYTREGQAERLKNALETSGFRLSGTQFSGGSEEPTNIPGATTAINALNAAAVVYGGAKVFSSIASWSKVGALAASPGGAQLVAGTVPEAATAAGATTAVVGQVAKNPSTVAQTINFLKTMSLQNKAISIGAVLTIMGTTSNKITTVEGNRVDFSKESGDLQVDLRRVGLNDMADELYNTNKDLVDDFDSILTYVPYFGGNSNQKAIEKARDELNDANRAYEQAVEQEKVDAINKQLEDEVKAADVKRQQDLTDAATKREQELTDRADSRAYEEKQKQEERAYQQQTTSQAAIDQAKLDATATIDSGGSTLQFGLLGTGGSTEFVDKDKASKVYFGKVYDELTPEQKLLLNLLKGGN